MHTLLWMRVFHLSHFGCLFSFVFSLTGFGSSCSRRSSRPCRVPSGSSERSHLSRAPRDVSLSSFLSFSCGFGSCERCSVDFAFSLYSLLLLFPFHFLSPFLVPLSVRRSVLISHTAIECPPFLLCLRLRLSMGAAGCGGLFASRVLQLKVGWSFFWLLL